MADRKHPSAHVKDQDIKGLREQPLSPQHEGIDPLTEGDTMLERGSVDTPKKKSTKKK